ncbi:MAG: hypothetical protein R2704_17190 [Microthrixaceae bacterium]
MRSISRRAIVWLKEAASPMASRRCSSSWVRLGNPVSASCSAWWRRRSSARTALVTSSKVTPNVPSERRSPRMLNQAPERSGNDSRSAASGLPVRATSARNRCSSSAEALRNRSLVLTPAATRSGVRLRVSRATGLAKRSDNPLGSSGSGSSRTTQPTGEWAVTSAKRFSSVSARARRVMSMSTPRVGLPSLGVGNTRTRK